MAFLLALARARAPRRESCTLSIVQQGAMHPLIADMAGFAHFCLCKQELHIDDLSWYQYIESILYERECAELGSTVIPLVDVVAAILQSGLIEDMVAVLLILVIRESSVGSSVLLILIGVVP